MGELQRRYHTTATGEIIESLFLPDVGRTRGGTLLSEPVVVARGRYRRSFELLDQDMVQLGSAVALRWLPRVAGISSGLTTVEFRDPHGLGVIKMERYQAKTLLSSGGMT